MTPAILVCTVLLVYCFFGYPLLISVLSKLKRLQISSQTQDEQALSPPRLLSIVLCVHNASSLIEKRLRNLFACEWNGPIEVIVYCDGCTDDTVIQLQPWLPRGLRIIESTSQRSKAAGLNVAIPACSSPLVILCDVRQEFASDALQQLVAPFADPKVAAVSGHLSIKPSESGVGRGVDLYWQLESKLREWEGHIDSVIGCTGAIYAIRRDLYQPLPVDTLLDDVVIPMSLAFSGGRIFYQPSATAYDPQTLDPTLEQTRKLRTLVGNFQMLERYPAWIIPGKSRLWWQLISHKYLRLLVPWLLIALAVLSVGAPKTPFIQLMILAQAIAYACATLGSMLPKVRSRLLTVPAGFAALQLTCFKAFFAYLKHRRNYLALWQNQPAPIPPA